jgi:histidinol phosphatase-like enzyme
MKIVIDVDGTICSQEKDYSKAKPFERRIKRVNDLYDQGHKIVFFTARGYETKIDWSLVTRKQLSDWGVKYHDIIFGKPSADVYIDDRSEKDNWLGEI